MSDGSPHRLHVADETRLRFPPHVRFRFDEVRGCWIVLAPERLFMPDETAVEILTRLDGVRSVGDIVTELASRFDAPRDVIAEDVLALLQDLADKGVVVA